MLSDPVPSAWHGSCSIVHDGRETEAAMNEALQAFTEQRDDVRLSAHWSARFEAPHAIFAPTGSAIIEEFSSCGLRLRTESQLHPDEELVVKVAAEPFPLHARVIWV